MMFELWSVQWYMVSGLFLNYSIHDRSISLVVKKSWQFLHVIVISKDFLSQNGIAWNILLSQTMDL